MGVNMSTPTPNEPVVIPPAEYQEMLARLDRTLAVAKALAARREQEEAILRRQRAEIIEQRKGER